MPLTDAEVICTFMEPKPTNAMGFVPSANIPQSILGWWWLEGIGHPNLTDWVHPRNLTLNECREVQERLNPEDWRAYRRECCLLIWDAADGGHGTANLSMTHGELMEKMLHLTAEQKIKALAATLRAKPGTAT